MCGAVAAFETEKKKTLVRIFHWRPDMHGYYHSAETQDVLLMTPAGVVLICILCIIGGQNLKKRKGVMDHRHNLCKYNYNVL